ncbi:MAG: hypothetical protein VKI63_04430 [Cyanobium sp.]|nr:hypothetical protein [Cyanobium sp.]
MCFSSPPPATITMPDTGAYDRMADLQIAAMQQQQQGMLSMGQLELNQAIERQRAVLEQARDFNIQRANDVAANAQRMAALLGPPPPEPTATAPVVGGDRQGMRRAKGKSDLRIDRPAATTQAAGTGLNITTAS